MEGAGKVIELMRDFLLVCFITGSIDVCMYTDIYIYILYVYIVIYIYTHICFVSCEALFMFHRLYQKQRVFFAMCFFHGSSDQPLGPNGAGFFLFVSIDQ